MAAVKGPALRLSQVNEHVQSPPSFETTPRMTPTLEGRPAFEIEEHPIDQVRPIKVGVIGAGLAGITAGILFPVKLPGLDLRIYDKNADVVRYLPTFYMRAVVDWRS